MPETIELRSFTIREAANVAAPPIATHAPPPPQDLTAVLCWACARSFHPASTHCPHCGEPSAFADLHAAPLAPYAMTPPACADGLPEDSCFGPRGDVQEAATANDAASEAVPPRPALRITWQAFILLQVIVMAIVLCLLRLAWR